jgi:hypothetical protein
MATTILLADTVTRLTLEHAGHVVVTGSHGGMIAASYVSRARVRAAVFNDAGRGCDDAGIAGLAVLDGIGVAAFAIAHTSARIGDAGDSFAHGIVSACNQAAAAFGVTMRMPCAEAAQRVTAAPWHEGVVPIAAEARSLFARGKSGHAPVWGLDSIGLVDASVAGAILIIGSHGALHGGDPASALGIAARAAFFHDAGRGKDDAGISRLPALAVHGLPAAAVDYRSARIGDARSLWMTGILSAVNAPARSFGIREGMRVRDAVQRLQLG